MLIAASSEAEYRKRRSSHTRAARCDSLMSFHLSRRAVARDSRTCPGATIASCRKAIRCASRGLSANLRRGWASLLILIVVSIRSPLRRFISACQSVSRALSIGKSCGRFAIGLRLALVGNLRPAGHCEIIRWRDERAEADKFCGQAFGDRATLPARRAGFPDQRTPAKA